MATAVRGKEQNEVDRQEVMFMADRLESRARTMVEGEKKDFPKFWAGFRPKMEMVVPRYAKYRPKNQWRSLDLILRQTKMRDEESKEHTFWWFQKVMQSVGKKMAGIEVQKARRTIEEEATAEAAQWLAEHTTPKTSAKDAEKTLEGDDGEFAALFKPKETTPAQPVAGKAREGGKGKEAVKAKDSGKGKDAGKAASTSAKKMEVDAGSSKGPKKTKREVKSAAEVVNSDDAMTGQGAAGPSTTAGKEEPQPSTPAPPKPSTRARKEQSPPPKGSIAVTEACERCKKKKITCWVHPASIASKEAKKHQACWCCKGLKTKCSFLNNPQLYFGLDTSFVGYHDMVETDDPGSVQPAYDRVEEAPLPQTVGGVLAQSLAGIRQLSAEMSSTTASLLSLQTQLSAYEKANRHLQDENGRLRALLGEAGLRRLETGSASRAPSPRLQVLPRPSAGKSKTRSPAGEDGPRMSPIHSDPPPPPPKTRISTKAVVRRPKSPSPPGEEGPDMSPVRSDGEASRSAEGEDDDEPEMSAVSSNEDDEEEEDGEDEGGQDDPKKHGEDDDKKHGEDDDEDMEEGGADTTTAVPAMAKGKGKGKSEVPPLVTRGRAREIETENEAPVGRLTRKRQKVVSGEEDVGEASEPAQKRVRGGEGDGTGKRGGKGGGRGKAAGKK